MKRFAERIHRKALWLAVLGLITLNLYSQPVAFPGAEGFGKWASGGRNGEVAAVTNLLDDPANPPEGSFRWALSQAYVQIPHPTNPDVMITVARPLTIVFRVSGIIELQDELTIQRSNLTIAGQTAPGDGICFKGNYFSISGGGGAGTHNVILRYLRFRPGIDIDSAALSHGIAGLGVENCENIIVDHCSFSWANEECAIFYDNKYVTVQWCIASEGLYDAGHAKGSRSYCGVWGGQYSSFHHNLIAHNRSRTIRFNGARAHDKEALVDYRNNVIYNWNNSGGCYGGEVEIKGGFSEANMIGNYYKPGPATPSSLYFVAPSWVSADNTAYGVGKWHLDGNIMESSDSKTNDNWLGVNWSEIPSAQRPAAKSLIPFRIEEPLPTDAAEEAYALVLEKVGAAYPKRDPVDTRIVNETSTGTATGTGVIGNGIIDDPVVVGGYPEYNTYDVPDDNDGDGMDDAWESQNGLDPANPEDRNNLNDEGYTMLEVYINSLVEDLTVISPPVVHVKGINRNYCAGGDPDMLFGSPAGGTFTAGDGFTIIGGDTAIFDPVSAGDYTIKYYYDDGEGYTDSITEIINVRSLPEASINGLDSSYNREIGFATLTGSPENGAFLTAPGIKNPGFDEALFDLSEIGEYTIYYRYIDAYGCEDTAVAHTVIHPGTFVGDPGINDQIRIFPNPAKELVRVISDLPVEKIGIYSVSGILIREVKGTGISEVEIRDLSGGIYYLIIYNDSGATVKRLAKL